MAIANLRKPKQPKQSVNVPNVNLRFPKRKSNEPKIIKLKKQS